MNQHSDTPLSPTLTKVLDTFLEAMKADADIENAAADRLDALLRSGKTPKTDEIETALFSSPKDEAENAEEPST